MLVRARNILVNAPAEDVFGYVADIRRHPDWAANPLQIHHVAGPESGVGATFTTNAHRTVGFAGTFQGRIRVLIEEPPRRFVYRTEDTSGRYQWTFLIAPQENGTRLTHRMEKLSGPWILRWLQPAVLWPLIGKKQVKRGLENIKAQFEQKIER